jgi:hypothetical protein
MRFWLDIYEEGIKLGHPTDKTVSPRETIFMRYVNDIVMAAKDLCIAAASGSRASEKILKHEPVRLIRAAGDVQRTREARRAKREPQ